MNTLENTKPIIEDYEKKVAQLDFQIESYDFLNSGNNPYSFAGKMHNDCLDYLNKKEAGSTIKKLILSAADFYVTNDNGFIKKFDDSFIEKLSISSETLFLEIKKKSTIDLEIINLLKCNKSMTSELLWLLDSILNFNILFDSFTNKIEELNQWELKIKNSNYNNETQIPLLLSSAVARYSFHFWYHNYETNNFKKKDRKKKCLQTTFTVAADVIGTAGGAVAGFTAGGPVGAVVGGVVMGGAMSGAAYSIFT